MRHCIALATLLSLAAGTHAQPPTPKEPQLQEPAPKEPLAHEPKAMPPAEAVVLNEKAALAAKAVTEQSLMETVGAFPLKRSPNGGPEHEAGLKATEELIITRLKAMGYEPQVHEFAWTSPGRRLGKDPQAAPEQPAEILYRNIFTDIVGKERPTEVLIVGGHFDAVPMGPGADDNASGAAAVLELARVYKQLGPPACTIRLMWFNLEEVGLVGARAYVTKWIKDRKEHAAAHDGAPRETIKGMLSLEMLGYYSDLPKSQSSPIPPIKGTFEPSTVGDTIAVVGIKTYQSFSQPLMKLMSVYEPAVKITSVDFMPIPIPDMMRSDHQPFVVAGLPGVMVTDTANFRNPNYHTATDTIDTLDGPRYTRTVRALTGAIWHMADQPAAKD